MSKFKVGDTVKVIEGGYEGKFSDGCELIVGKILVNGGHMCYPEGNDPEVDHDLDNGTLYFHEGQLELVEKPRSSSKFKVGDLVTILTTQSAPEDTVGKIGKVISHEFGSYLVDVSDSTHENKKWYYSENQLGFPISKPKTLGELLKEATERNSKKSTSEVVGEALKEYEKQSTGTVALTPNQAGGVKADQGKIDYTYLLKDLPVSVEEVTKVLMYGAKKYNRSNYSKVESERYEAAALRHIMAYLQGERLDSETGYHHLAHVTCCLLFLVEREVKKGE